MEELIAGQIVKNKVNGKIGTIVGTTDSPRGKTLHLDFDGQRREVPISEFSSRYLAAESPSVRKPALPSNKQEIEFNDLSSYIKDHRGYVEGDPMMDLSELTQDPELKIEIKNLILEALENNYVFRGDARHPNALSRYDKKLGISQGIFEKGFSVINGDANPLYGECIDLASSLDTAIQYPQPSDMPRDWDGTSFIYIVDPSEYRGRIELIKDLGNLVCYDDVPPSCIKASIQIDGKNERVPTRVWRNDLKSTTDGDTQI